MQSKSVIITYLSLRKAVGTLGLSLPFLLVCGTALVRDCQIIQGSISAYYYTSMGDVFVAVISAIAFFLFFYPGYEKKDRIACRLAALFALGVAFFPTLPETYLDCFVKEKGVSDSLINGIHLFFAVAFFLTITFIALFLFTKTGDKPMTASKRKRNLIYRVCGGIMIASLFLIGLYLLLGYKYAHIQHLKPVFFLESIALIAFGVSWLVKGQVIYKEDRKSTDETA